MATKQMFFVLFNITFYNFLPSNTFTHCYFLNNCKKKSFVTRLLLNVIELSHILFLSLFYPLIDQLECCNFFCVVFCGDKLLSNYLRPIWRMCICTSKFLVDSYRGAKKLVNAWNFLNQKLKELEIGRIQ